MAQVDRWTEVIATAVAAPSSHNTQPWIFRAGRGGLELRADRTRALPVNDPHDRELTISCGAALLQARLGLRRLGFGALVQLLPDETDDDLLAILRAHDAAPPTPDEERLMTAIPERRTYRKAFSEREVPKVLIGALRAAVEAEGAWLHVCVSEDEKLALAKLVGEGDRILWSDPRWRRELAAWMHPRRSGDGLEVPWVASHVAPLIVRSFDLGGGQAAKDEDLARYSPVVAVLGTAGDTAYDWLRAGQALGRALLMATSEGLQASYLNQPIQVEALRPQVAQTIASGGKPQLILRFGYPRDRLRASPRRPLDDVLEP
jgi:nitroreductase